MGFRDFMSNRNGMDEFGRFLTFVTLGLIIVSFFIRTWILTILPLGLLIYVYFRMFSRNYTKRYEENQRFLEFKNKFLSFFTVGFKSIRDREHRYFRCPRCRRVLRVPKGKGRISIHCPTCGTDFIKKT